MTENPYLANLARLPAKLIRRIIARITGAPKSKHVVFLAGVQRSGTNMVMSILERSPETTVFHESDKRAFDQFQLRDDAVIQNLARSPDPCVVFKALCDNERVKSLMQSFPHASAIWVYRNYNDVIRSHVALFGPTENQIHRLVVNRTSAVWRGRGMTDETWALVKKLYWPEIDPASAQALFWYYRNQLFFDQGLDCDPSVYLLRYEDLARDPTGQVNKLGRFLGITLTNRAVAHVRADSVREKPAFPIREDIRDVCDRMLRRLDAVRARQESHALEPADVLLPSAEMGRTLHQS